MTVCVWTLNGSLSASQCLFLPGVDREPLAFQVNYWSRPVSQPEPGLFGSDHGRAVNLPRRQCEHGGRKSSVQQRILLFASS